jgi:hypothetical protein
MAKTWAKSIVLSVQGGSTAEHYLTCGVSADQDDATGGRGISLSAMRLKPITQTS